MKGQSIHPRAPRTLVLRLQIVSARASFGLQFKLGTMHSAAGTRDEGAFDFQHAFFVFAILVHKITQLAI